ncbi:MAG: hypothetical protein LC737_02415, partial [Chloroflexi bacterium]|nr:hypothetical protein [Chloroflexota bacterium]
MPDMLRGSVILESISVRSPGVGSMWEFTFKVDDSLVDTFKRNIADGQTATFRKTLYAKDIPAKSNPTLLVQVNVVERDPKRSDPGYGMGMIAIDGTFGRQERASFEATVIEKGGTNAGAMATLTFNLISEVREGVACEECQKEKDAAAPITDEFNTVAETLLATSGQQLPEAFAAALNTYQQAISDAVIARQQWDDLAAQVRTCAQQNRKAVKRTCLRNLDKIDAARIQLNAIEPSVTPLLNMRANLLGQRYASFAEQDRIELRWALYGAELKAKCADNLDEIQTLYNQANEQLQEEAARGGAFSTQADDAAKAAATLLARYQKAMTTRNKYVSRLSACASDASNFGPCAPLVQNLLVQDGQIAGTLLSLVNAYQAVVNLLK